MIKCLKIFKSEEIEDKIDPAYSRDIYKDLKIIPLRDQYFKAI
jgi:hypothetical protein